MNPVLARLLPTLKYAFFMLPATDRKLNELWICFLISSDPKHTLVFFLLLPNKNQPIISLLLGCLTRKKQTLALQLNSIIIPPGVFCVDVSAKK